MLLPQKGGIQFWQHQTHLAYHSLCSCPRKKEFSSDSTKHIFSLACVHVLFLNCSWNTFSVSQFMLLSLVKRLSNRPHLLKDRLCVVLTDLAYWRQKHVWSPVKYLSHRPHLLKDTVCGPHRPRLLKTEYVWSPVKHLSHRPHLLKDRLCGPHRPHLLKDRLCVCRLPSVRNKQRNNSSYNH